MQIRGFKIVAEKDMVEAEDYEPVVRIGEPVVSWTKSRSAC